jgi:hypothetical protein
VVTQRTTTSRTTPTRAPKTPQVRVPSSPRATPTPKGPVVPPAAKTPAKGGGGTTGGGTSKGGGARVHPAAADAGSLTPAGHRAYCARNVQHAVQGAAAVAQHSATVQKGIKKNERMTWALKAMAKRRNKRADRKVIAAYQALAKAWLNKAKVRDQVDAEVNASAKQRPSDTTYTTE